MKPVVVRKANTGDYCEYRLVLDLERKKYVGCGNPATVLLERGERLNPRCIDHGSNDLAHRALKEINTHSDAAPPFSDIFSVFKSWIEREFSTTNAASLSSKP